MTIAALHKSILHEWLLTGTRKRVDWTYQNGRTNMNKIFQIAVALIATLCIQLVVTALAATLGADPSTATALSVGIGAAAIISFLS